jgi:hypothetical protein
MLEIPQYGGKKHTILTRNEKGEHRSPFKGVVGADGLEPPTYAV